MGTIVRTFFWLAFTAAVLAALFPKPAHTQSQPVYLVTYLELMADSVEAGAALLRHYRNTSVGEDGNERFDTLGEIARSNRFVIFEVWKDQAALDAHVRSAASVQFKEKLNPLQAAPDDVRVDTGLYLDRRPTENDAGAIYAVTHIDVIPTGTNVCLAALKAMSVDTKNDSGNISYQVLRQANRANHFTVVEQWADMKAAQAHAMAEHTRAFRDKLIPIAGALYDERFFKALN